MQNIHFLKQDGLKGYGSGVLGYYEAPKSIIFGFKNIKHIEYVKKHIRYIDTDIVTKMKDTRYLIKSHFNEENNINKRVIRVTQIIHRNLYESVLLSQMNNVNIGMVYHIAERDDGDLEILCKILENDIESFKPNEKMIKHNLGIIFKNMD